MSAKTYISHAAQPRRRRAWPWIVAAAALVIAALLVLFAFVLPGESVFPGQWYCKVEDSLYYFTEDGGFSTGQSQLSVVYTGTYKAGWRYLTLNYTQGGEQISVRTRYTLYDNGQLVLHNVNGSQVVLVRNP